MVRSVPLVIAPSMRALTVPLAVAAVRLRPSPTMPPAFPAAIAFARSVDEATSVIAEPADRVASLSTKESRYGLSVAVAVAPLDPTTIPPDEAKAAALAPVPLSTLPAVSVL